MHVHYVSEINENDDMMWVAATWVGVSGKH